MRAALILLTAAYIGAAQPAHLINARVETRAIAGGLQATIQQIATAGQPAWIAYAVPMAEGEHHTCGGWNNKVMLEGAKELILFYRVEQGEVKRLRTLSEECEIDAGNMPVYWLTNVNAAESVAWLQSLSAQSQWINAISMHRDPAAVAALIAIVERERTSKQGRQAMNLLTRSKDPRATAYLAKVLAK